MVPSYGPHNGPLVAPANGPQNGPHNGPPLSRRFKFSDDKERMLLSNAQIMKIRMFESNNHPMNVQRIQKYSYEERKGKTEEA